MSETNELLTRTRVLRRQLDGKVGEARLVIGQAKETQDRVAALSQDIQDLEQVSMLLNSIGEEKQLAAQDLIESIVTLGLKTIFDPTLSFHIVQSVKGKTPVVEFLVRTTLPGSIIETPVLEARGGGLAATIGFLLRVVVMLLAHKDTNKENLLLLDESFAMVSEEYLPPLREFIRDIADKTGIQILMVTHQPQFEEIADRVYRFSTVDGSTVVERQA